MKLIIFCALAYLAGSVNFSLLATRLAGKGDLRRVGSGNAGATNAFRALGPGWAALILLLDIGRGVAVALLAAWLLVTPWSTILGCLAVVAGNLFPVFHQFKGGKGFATSLGIYFGVDPLAALSVVGAWLVIVFITRMASVGTLTGAALFVVLVLCLGRGAPTVFLAAALLAIIAFTHRRNIRRILRGYEHKLGDKRRN